jgi:hypothetical protein
MKHLIWIVGLTLWLGLGLATDADAQCAMCRQTVENNLSSGASRIGAGLNTGILYLMSIPYIAMSVVLFLWYKTSRANRAKRLAVAERLRSAGV